MYIELKDINKTFGNYKASDHVEFGIENILAVLVSDTVAVLVQLIHPALL